MAGMQLMGKGGGWLVGCGEGRCLAQVIVREPDIISTRLFVRVECDMHFTGTGIVLAPHCVSSPIMKT